MPSGIDNTSVIVYNITYLRLLGASREVVHFEHRHAAPHRRPSGTGGCLCGRWL